MTVLQTQRAVQEGVNSIAIRFKLQIHSRPSRPGSHCHCACVRVQSLSCVRLSATLKTVSHQAPPSIGFSRQGYWSGLPFPIPVELPDLGIKPTTPESPSLVGRIFTPEPAAIVPSFKLRTKFLSEPGPYCFPYLACLDQKQMTLFL